MRILDRYIISLFLKNYIISFLVLVGLYIALDMVLNFDELTRGAGLIGRDVEAGAVAASQFATIIALVQDIGGYYFYQMFLFFVHLSGIIPVVAAAFTLMRLSRFNELTAMLAAGTPLLRIAAPVVIVGMLLSVVLVVDQEVLIPRMIPMLIRQHDQLREANGPKFQIRAMQADDQSLLMAGRYHPPIGTQPATMEQVDIIERDENLQPTVHILADRAEYSKHGVWRLTNGRRMTGLRPGQPVTSSALAEYRTSITPVEIALYRSSEVVDLLSVGQINRLLEHPKNYGTIDLLRVKHWRVTQPLANIIMLLLAIPCVLTREPGSLKTSALKCVFLSGLCMASLFLAHQIAGNPPASARLARSLARDGRLDPPCSSSARSRSCCWSG